MNVPRIASLIAASLAIAGCDYPPVPHDPGATIEGDHLMAAPEPGTPARYSIGPQSLDMDEPIELQEPMEVRGKLVGNSTSHYVISPEDSHSWLQLEVTPQTVVRIGDQLAGPREIQPGSEVRATFVPVREEHFGLAVEVVADPMTMGWDSGRYDNRPPVVQEEPLPEASD